MSERHTTDLRNVVENDEVTLTTDDGETIEAQCIERLVENADPRTGEARETTIYRFRTAPDTTLAASITDGLRSSADDPEFPVHSELWNEELEVGVGYIDTVQIHGQSMEAR